MNKSLRTKAVIILAVILICIYGIIGIPKSREELVRNWHNSIKLGLDLRGGSHLVLQVQVQDAFIAEAAQAIERLKDELQKAGIPYTSIDNTEPKTIQDADKVQITVRGIPAEKAGTFRSVVQDRVGMWNLNSVNSTDYALTIKPTEALALRRSTVERTQNTIENASTVWDWRSPQFSRAADRMPRARSWSSCPGLTIRRASSKFCKPRPFWSFMK